MRTLGLLAFLMLTMVCSGQKTVVPAENLQKYILPCSKEDSLTVGDVVINEILAINNSVVMDDYGEYNDWVELYNCNAYTVSLECLYLSDSYNNPLKWQFPLGTTMGPNAYLIVWVDGDSTQTIGFHTPFKLSGSGEKVILSYVSGYIVDSVRFGQQIADITWGRYPNGTGPFMALTPTFAAQNTYSGINEHTAEDCDVYPNPADEFISINTGSEKLLNARLFNSTGQLVLQSSSETIDLSGIHEGLYYISITTNKYTATRKLIVKR